MPTLKEWRERQDLTQGDAALLIGCGRRSLQKWEAGENNVPHYIGLACSAVAAGLKPFASAPRSRTKSKKR
jgi:DNA-binding XRE family transcriptional regulator